MPRLIECVPNFSEGRDATVIHAITSEIETVDGVRLLDVDPGKATNRTVVTFVGEPEAVVEAAVRCARKAGEVIDMRQHKGEHPRFGAIDVCPLVPVSGVTMDETVKFARELGRRFGAELGITGWFYESAATSPARKNLAAVRAGEYEGLAAKLRDPAWKPDFGPATFDAQRGACAVGARDFLVAYNVNLNTTSTRRANAIAYDVREKGREKRTGDPVTGEIVRDAKGQPVWIPGSLKAVKAIGWFIEEYGVAQISINLTNIAITPIHVAFDEVCKKAAERGVRVTGSQIVGMVPLRAMLDAGRHYLQQQRRSSGVSDRELVKIARKSLGLDDLGPFEPTEKIIEYKLAKSEKRRRLVGLSVEDFVWETASESPAPGGGSVAAAVGALGAALATMVANLSSHKRGWDERWQEFSSWAEKGKACHDELLALVDADTDAFNAILAAGRMPQGTPAESAARSAAVEAATRGAIEVPLRTMEVALRGMDVVEAMVERGQESSLSDAGVAALCVRAAVIGAHMNVRINARGLADRGVAREYLERAERVRVEAVKREARVVEVVEGRLGKG